jgi:uncharacterized protein
MKSLLAFFALLFALCNIAFAQTAPAPGHARAAEELLSLMEMNRMLKRTSDAMLESQIQQTPHLAQFEDLMRQFMDTHLRWETMKPEYIRLYTDLFSERELRDLTAFYRSPLGRKLIETTPELTVRTANITHRHLQQHMPELQQKIMERMQRN